MKKKTRSKSRFWGRIRQFLPYVAVFLAILSVAKIGADTKLANNSSLNMQNFVENGYNVSADQLSELYVVASLSSSFNLASVETVSGNYVTVSVMKEISQTSTDLIEKPNFVGTNISRGVQTYTVKDGETMASIAAAFGLTTDQIRWSNDLKTTDVSPGQTLVLPVGVAGIVYTVKAGDTPESLAEKYGSNAAEIVAYNDLETSALTEGMQIVLPGGVLPETERPEYVAPVRYYYTYYGSTSDRQNLYIVYENIPYSGANNMGWGQCTYYAWWWRAAHGNPLPGSEGDWGHARYWASHAAAIGMRVDRTPSVGAVFQTTGSSPYGHVGIVVGINSDGSIVVREMNYGGRINIVTESTIPANIVGNFNYIH